MAMEKFRKETRKHYSLLDVYQCPISLIRAAVELSEGDATVENLHPNHTAAWFPLEMQLFPGDEVAIRTVRWASLDVTLKRENFLDLLSFWDRNGVYAVFSTLGPIKFRSTHLEGDARYVALKKFNWSLELAIPGSSGAEWGHIASPDPKKIDLLFAKAGASYA
jgi:hypothetical protein